MAYTTAIQVRLTREQAAKWRRAAKKLGKTVADMIRDAVNFYVVIWR